MIDDYTGIAGRFGLLGKLLWGAPALLLIHEDDAAIRCPSGIENYHGIGGKNRKEKTLAECEGLFASWGIVYANLRPRSECIIMCIMVRFLSPQVPRADFR